MSRPATWTRMTAAEMFELFKRLNAEGKTVLYVTHDMSLAERAHRSGHDPRRRSSREEAEMVSPPLLRKSISDLTRRRARAFFAVAALALAVASVGLFALPTLMSRAMIARSRPTSSPT